MTTFLTAAVTALVAELARQILAASAGRARARRAGAAAIYRLTIAGRLVIDAAILLMGGLAYLVVANGEDWRIAALLGGFTALCVFAYPGAIVVDPVQGLQSKRWYSRPVEMAWIEVSEMRCADLVGQTTIASSNGRTIVHTSLHADSAGFRRDVLRYAPHCAKK
jgi:hypothetical protein